MVPPPISFILKMDICYGLTIVQLNIFQVSESEKFTLTVVIVYYHYIYVHMKAIGGDFAIVSLS